MLETLLLLACGLADPSDLLNETATIVGRAELVHRFADTAPSLTADELSDVDDWFSKLKDVTASVKDVIGADGDVQGVKESDLETKLKALREAANRAHVALRTALAHAREIGAPQSDIQNLEQAIEEEQKQIEIETERVVQRLVHRTQKEVTGIEEQIEDEHLRVARKALAIAHKLAQSKRWGDLGGQLGEELGEQMGEQLGQGGFGQLSGMTELVELKRASEGAEVESAPARQRAVGEPAARLAAADASLALVCGLIATLAVALRRRIRGAIDLPFCTIERILPASSSRAEELAVAMLDTEAGARYTTGDPDRLTSSCALTA